MTLRTIARAPRLYDLHPPADRLWEDVRAGLALRPRKLPPKYFYDEAGALLFDRITRLEAYYPTRTELRILDRHMGEIVEAIGPSARILELGSGSGLKTRHLLHHLLRPASYMPVDISRAQLMEFATSIAGELPALEVLPVCADYTQEWTPPAGQAQAARTVAFFPGSTIGNFEPDDAVAFLRRVRSLCGPGSGLLIGVDLHKDRPTLERAYNDGEGVTAAFNLNLLERINRECGADFDTGAFRHHAFYDERRRRIEMRLVSTRHSTVTLPGRVPGGGSTRPSSTSSRSTSSPRSTRTSTRCPTSASWRGQQAGRSSACGPTSAAGSRCGSSAPSPRSTAATGAAQHSSHRKGRTRRRNEYRPTRRFVARPASVFDFQQQQQMLLRRERSGPPGLRHFDVFVPSFEMSV